MKNESLRLLLLLVSTNAALSLTVGCGGEERGHLSSANLPRQQTSLVASSTSCAKNGLQAGAEFLNDISLDQGATLPVYSEPNAIAPIIGYFNSNGQVSIKSLETGNSTFVEISASSTFVCTAASCDNSKLFVAHEYLEPANYQAQCHRNEAESVQQGDEVIVANQSPQSDAMDRYSNHPKTKEMIRYGKRNAGPSQGLCLRGVKKAMTYGGKFFSSYPGVSWAVKFGPEMQRVQFTDVYAQSGYRASIQQSMENVPVGCIVVYKGVDTRADRNAKYGHIEIRTPDGFVSDYFSARPRTGSWARISGNNRQVISVFCKI